MGTCFFIGDDVPSGQDYAEAVRFYKSAAAQGFTEAEQNLGVITMNGDGVERDPAESVRLLQRAAANLGVRGCEGRARLRPLSRSQYEFK